MPHPNTPPEVPGPLPGGVLLDMDGTLVDTEPFWHAAELEITAAHSVDWRMQDCIDWTGRPMNDLATELHCRGVPVDPDDIVQWMVEFVLARTSADIPWLPGARELLRGIAALGIPAAIVTNAARANADLVASQAPAGALVFARSKDDVAIGKPHPMPYLTAAARLGIDPSRSIAIEDSAAGARSAHAAGLNVWFINAHTADAGIPVDRVISGPGDVRADQLADRLRQLAAAGDRDAAGERGAHD